MEYTGASSKVLNIRKAAAAHNNAVWANDDGPGVTNYANGCGSRANILWPHGTFRIDIDLIKPQGQVIGEEGNTGYSTGPHLHFEIRQNGTAINPATLIKL
jgi:hypothetical protein